MTRKARIEGSATKIDLPAFTPDQPKKLADVLTAYIAANPEKWEEMKLWPAQSAFAEIVAK